MYKSCMFSCIGLLIATSAFADIDDRLDDLEREMRQVSIYTPQDTIGAGFTSARPEVLVEGERVNITFDLLYWHPKVGGTEYAYSFQPNIVQTGSIILPEADGRTKYNDLDWEWGLKVGLGYNLPHDGWDLTALYTWYEPNSTTHSTKASPSALMPLRLFTTMLALKAKSHFDLAYHNVDVNLGRSYFVSRMIAFRPFVSVKTTWLDLDQNVIYTASSLNDFLFPGPERTTGLDFKSKNSSHFWGIGPRLGLNSKWFLGNGFNLFNDVAGSILYGYFKTRHKEFVPPNEAVFDSGDIIKGRYRFHRFIPFVQMYLGMGWQGYVNHDKQYITLKLGYEVQYYWRVNQMHQEEDVSNPPGSFSERVHYERYSDDVMLYGITGEFKLDF